MKIIKRILTICICLVTLLSGTLTALADDSDYYTDTGMTKNVKLTFTHATTKEVVEYDMTFKQNPNGNGRYAKMFDVIPVIADHSNSQGWYIRTVMIYVVNGSDILSYNLYAKAYKDGVYDESYFGSQPVTGTDIVKQQGTIRDVTLPDGTVTSVSGYIDRKYDFQTWGDALNDDSFTLNCGHIKLNTFYNDIGLAYDAAEGAVMAMVCKGITPSQLGVGEYIASENEDGFNENTATYDPSIGYLQMSALYGSYNKETDELLRTFPWESKTTENFDVTRENVRVGIYTKFHGYYFTSSMQYMTQEGYGEYVSEHPNYYNDVPGADLQGVVNERDLYEYYASEKEKLKELSTAWIAQPIVKYEYWFRVEVYNPDSGMWSYGGWTKFADKNMSQTEGDNTVTNVDPEGNIGEEKPSDKYTEDTEGNPVEVPDSEQDLTEWESGFDLMDNFIDGIQGMQSGLGKVPQIIGNVFTALPSWIVAAIGAGFVLAIILRIIGR